MPELRSYVERLAVTNEELLLEYEFATMQYLAVAEKKNDEALEKYEKYLCELKAEILKRMEQSQTRN